MKKIAFLTLIILFNTFNSFAQISKIRLEVNKIFFEFPSSSERFDIKSIVNGSENFYDYYENSMVLNSISVGFEENPSLSYLGLKNTIILFFKGSKKYDQLVLKSEYGQKDVNQCKQQLIEVLDIFKKLSYKTYESVSRNGNNDIIGRGYSFYSSSNSLSKKKTYLSISLVENYKGEYVFDIHYYPTNLY